MTHGVAEWLLTQSSLTDLIGLNAEGDTHKIYNVVIPEKESLPFICVSTTSIEPQRCKGSQATSEKEVVQVNCYASSYEQAKLIYRTVRNLLDANTFTVPSDGTVTRTDITGGRDMNPGEADKLQELYKLGIWGIISFYEAQVKLGTIT